MAITITKEPTEFYPAYNESYILFSTDYTVDNRAFILVDNEYPFSIYPNQNGEYLFNLKHIASALINTNKFRDNIDYNSGWSYSDDSLFLSLSVSITVYGDSANESINKEYTFSKAVKQVGDINFSNPYQLLLPSNDGLNYNLKYFEGFPLDVGFRYINNAELISIRNERTEGVTQNFIGTGSPFRLVIDTGLTNWNVANILKMPDLLNPLKIRVGGVERTSLNIDKQEMRNGIYLKWFNSDGGYSYWLFNRFFKSDYKSGEIDRVGVNNFNNIYNQNQDKTAITGKELEKSLTLKAQLSETEFNHVKSLISSPLVQMWSSQEPYQDGEWLDVKVTNRGLSNNSKQYIKQVEIDIEFPEQNTQFI
jgi:hypothetical protein